MVLNKVTKYSLTLALDAFTAKFVYQNVLIQIFSSIVTSLPCWF